MRLFAGSAVMMLVALALAPQATAEVGREVFVASGGSVEGYLVVEVLDDDLVHFEASAAGPPPPATQALYTSPMVLRTDYPGPATFSSADGVIETAELRVEIDITNLCVTVTDITEGDRYLTTVCPVDLLGAEKGLNIDPGEIEQVYGLGQQFRTLGSADGDWIAHGVRRGEGEFGNGFAGFQNAAVGNVQIPVYYAVDPGGVNYALFLDNVYRQRWDFTVFWWEARMYGDQLRWYVLAGPDLPDLRADYMELTGRPPVPPRKAFGLWVSEFGYDNWDQVETLLAGLRSARFPVDGFVLDLNWFGGVVLGDPTRSTMGALVWDEDQTPALAANPYSFPDPADEIAGYHDRHVGLVAIEESYLANTTATFAEMPTDLTAYQRTDGACDPANQVAAVTDVSGFWGIGRMIDWSDPAAGAWIHEERRLPSLSSLGITGHWTDLGEPETFSAGACYDGVETTAAGPKVEHPDIHNIYNLLWNQSIWDGYVAEAGQANALGIVNPRPLIVTRSGAAGTQRTGAVMWSGDIASNLDSLATHLNAQMHMTFSGIDYYGSDIGGFRREVLPYNTRDGGYRGYEAEMFTQWFANGAWFDVPVRPHTDNEFVVVDPPYDTAPHLVGHVPSNLANLRQRYRLIPYYYSLAHLAHQTGAPVIAPLVFYHQDDPATAGVGHEKLIGRDLLVAVVARHGEYERNVYLPAGRWADFHTGEWIESVGETVENVPVYRDGLLRLPVFARGGAILPMMPVDETTLDAFGHRSDAATRDDTLIVRVYADPQETRFTLFEDDGTTLIYDGAGRPSYHHRTTELRQQQTDDDTVVVTIGGAVDVNGAGPFPGAATERGILVELVVDGAEATAVSLDGAPLSQLPDREALDVADAGWVNAGANLILARAAPATVGNERVFSVTLQPIAHTTSVSFVCDNGVTVPGQSVYVAGSIPALGNFDPAAAVRLTPSVYYGYITDPPPGHLGPGPSQPVWTGVIAGLPANPDFEWKCIRRAEDGSGQPDFEPGNNNVFSAAVPSGYAGRAYGRF